MSKMSNLYLMAQDVIDLLEMPSIFKVEGVNDLQGFVEHYPQASQIEVINNVHPGTTMEDKILILRAICTIYDDMVTLA